MAPHRSVSPRQMLVVSDLRDPRLLVNRRLPYPGDLISGQVEIFDQHEEEIGSSDDLLTFSVRRTPHLDQHRGVATSTTRLVRYSSSFSSSSSVDLELDDGEELVDHAGIATTHRVNGQGEVTDTAQGNARGMVPPQDNMEDVPLDSSDDEDSEVTASWEFTHRSRSFCPSVREDTLSRRPQPLSTGLSRLNPWRSPPRQSPDTSCQFDDEDVEIIPSPVEPEVVYGNEEYGYTVDGWFFPMHVERHEREDWTWRQRHPYQALLSDYVQSARELPCVQEAEQRATTVHNNAVQMYDAAAASASGPARTARELAIVTGQVTHWLGSLAIVHVGELAVAARDRAIEAVQERMPDVIPAEMPLMVRRPELAWSILQRRARAQWAAGNWREYRELLMEAVQMLPPVERHAALAQGRYRR